MSALRTTAIVGGLAGVALAGIAATTSFEDNGGTSCGSVLSRRSVTQAHLEIASAMERFNPTDDLIDDQVALWRKNCDDETHQRMIVIGAGTVIVVLAGVGLAVDGKKKAQASVS